MKSVTITQNDDGSYAVAEESAEAPEMAGMEAGAEMPMGEMGEEAAPEGQQAASLDEALAIAGQMLDGDTRSPEEQIAAGYAKSKPSMGMTKPSPAQVFGG